MPPDSNWNTPVVRPELSRAKVFASSREMVSMSNFGSAVQANVVHGVGDDGERLQAEEVHLQQAELADGVHVELHGDVFFLQRGAGRIRRAGGR